MLQSDDTAVPCFGLVHTVALGSDSPEIVLPFHFPLAGWFLLEHVNCVEMPAGPLFTSVTFGMGS